MKFKDLQKKSPEDLDKELQKANFELMKYKSQAATGGAGKESGRIREIKRTIARIMTIKNKEVMSKQ